MIVNTEEVRILHRETQLRTKACRQTTGLSHGVVKKEVLLELSPLVDEEK